MNDRSETEDRAMTERVAGAYRNPAPFDPNARARLDQALDRLPSPRRARSWLGPLREPWAAGLRPRAALAALLVTLMVGVALGRWVLPVRAPERSTATARMETPASARTVQFVLVAPGASRVTVVGDFNGWDPDATPLERHGAFETWTTSVSLTPGRHVYAFVMDGDRWVSDPSAPLAPVNEFGFRNSVLIVGESEAS